VADFHDLEPINLTHQVGHAVILSTTELHNEVAARHKLRNRAFEHAA
jgi:hypothetical protein